MAVQGIWLYKLPAQNLYRPKMIVAGWFGTRQFFLILIIKFFIFIIKYLRLFSVKCSHFKQALTDHLTKKKKIGFGLQKLVQFTRILWFVTPV